MRGHLGRDRRNVRLSDGERRLRATNISATADLHRTEKKKTHRVVFTGSWRAHSMAKVGVDR